MTTEKQQRQIKEFENIFSEMREENELIEITREKGKFTLLFLYKINDKKTKAVKTYLEDSSDDTFEQIVNRVLLYFRDMFGKPKIIMFENDENKYEYKNGNLTLNNKVIKYYGALKYSLRVGLIMLFIKDNCMEEKKIISISK